MQASGPVAALTKRHDRTLLQSQGLVEIDHRFHLAQGCDQGGSPDGKTQSKATHAPTFRQREKLNAAVPPAWTAQQAGCLTGQGQIHIGIVVGNHQLVTDSASHHLIKQSLITDLRRRVVGIAEDKELEPVPGRISQCTEVRTPSVRGLQRQTQNIGTSQDCSAQMRRIAGIKHQSRVAGVENGQGKMRRAFLRAD